MTRIVAVDPGETTGIAMFVAGNLVFTAGFPSVAPQDIEALHQFILGQEPDLVVLEAPPQYPDKQILVQVHASLVTRLGAAGIPVIQINPGLWKPIMKRQRTQVNSAHQRDAADLGYYFLLFREETRG